MAAWLECGPAVGGHRTTLGGWRGGQQPFELRAQRGQLVGVDYAWPRWTACGKVIFMQAAVLKSLKKSTRDDSLISEYLH